MTPFRYRINQATNSACNPPVGPVKLTRFRRSAASGPHTISNRCHTKQRSVSVQRTNYPVDDTRIVCFSFRPHRKCSYLAVIHGHDAGTPKRRAGYDQSNRCKCTQAQRQFVRDRSPCLLSLFRTWAAIVACTPPRFCTCKSHDQRVCRWPIWLDYENSIHCPKRRIHDGFHRTPEKWPNFLRFANRHRSYGYCVDRIVDFCDILDGHARGTINSFWRNS